MFTRWLRYRLWTLDLGSRYIFRVIITKRTSLFHSITLSRKLGKKDAFSGPWFLKLTSWALNSGFLGVQGHICVLVNHFWAEISVLNVAVNLGEY